MRFKCKSLTFNGVSISVEIKVCRRPHETVLVHKPQLFIIVDFGKYDWRVWEGSAWKTNTIFRLCLTSVSFNRLRGSSVIHRRSLWTWPLTFQFSVCVKWISWCNLMPPLFYHSTKRIKHQDFAEPMLNFTPNIPN